MRWNARPVRLAPFALGVLSLALAGCVSLQRGGLFPEGRDRVFVEYFDNETFYRDVQFDLTEQLVSEILSRPGLRLSSKEEADIILTGRVVNVRQRVLSEDPTRTVTTESTTITVVMEVRDARTGEMIKTKRLSQRGEFVPESESIEDARNEAYVFLARDIVRELEVEF